MLVTVGRVGYVGQHGDYGDVDARNLASRFTTPLSSARFFAIDTLINTLKSAGIWNKLSSFQVYAAHASQAALVDWKTQSRTATETSSPTFTADRGYTTNGTSYIATAVNQNILSQNDHSLFFWTLTNSAANVVDIGSEMLSLNSRNSGNQISIRSASTTSNSSSVTTTTGNGLVAVSRISSGSAVIYKNGVLYETRSAYNSSSFTSSEIFVGGRNAAGLTSGASRQYACMGTATNLTADEHLALYNAINTYLVAVGAV